MDLHGKNILLIEDDQHIYSLIKAMFKPYEVKLTFKQNGKSGLKAAQENSYDLILLDIMLPKKDGWEICRTLKEQEDETPLIMLTAKVEETDKVLGLEMGADDYVTKPFSPRELLARIKAVLRRFEKTQQQRSSEEIIEFSKIGLVINSKSRSVFVRQENVATAPKEFKLLFFLAQNEGEAFSRNKLLAEIWGTDYQETRTVDEHIKRLRKKLKQAGLEAEPLQTVWGFGYKFELEGGSCEN